MRFHRSLAAPALLVLAALSCTRSEPVAAPVQVPFSDLTYAQALERAKTDDRIVLVDFTATWCPPCKALEETTWPDADVQAWIAREAVALKVDVDREPELSAKFRASSIPLIVFVESSGKELGRFVGYRDPAGFLAEAAKHVD